MLYLSVAALGLTFLSINAAVVPFAPSEAVASLMGDLPAEHAAGLASLMARGNDPLALESLLDKRQSSPMSDIIDSYIANLQQAGYVPNASPTTATSKRDLAGPDPLIKKRDVPSVPLVLALLGQHGFVTSNDSDSAASKRAIPDLDSPLQKRTLPDINLVVSRLAAHGFVPTGSNNTSSSSSKTKRDATDDINTTINQLEALGFNPADFMQGNSSSSSSSSSPSPNSSPDLSATTGITCPQDDNKIFGAGTEFYEVLCGKGYDGFDLSNAHADSMPDCLAACSAYVPQGDLASFGPCVGATWIASWADANCFFKYDAAVAGEDSRCVSGRKME